MSKPYFHNLFSYIVNSLLSNVITHESPSYRIFGGLLFCIEFIASRVSLIYIIYGGTYIVYKAHKDNK